MARSGAGKLAGPRLPPELSYLDEKIYKLAVVSLMRERLLMLRDRLGWIQFETWGPGRVDTFNAPKSLLNFPMEKAPEAEKLGNAELPSVWYQKAVDAISSWSGRLRPPERQPSAWMFTFRSCSKRIRAA